MSLPKRSIEDLKSITKILFIDDQNFKIVKNLKEKDGWRNVTIIKDVESISQSEIKDAHIIFVDIQGVGQKMGFLDGGLGVIVALKREYPEKFIIMYSAEDNGRIDAFHDANKVVDDRLRKDADQYEFNVKIEKFAQKAFGLDQCVRRLQDQLRSEYKINKEEKEIKQILEKLYTGNTYKDSRKIASSFGLTEAASIANIVQLFLSLA